MSTFSEEDDETLDSPLPSPDSEPAASPLDEPPAPPMMSPRSISASTAPTISNMTASSTPLGSVNAARGKPPTMSSSSLPARGAIGGSATQLNADIMRKMKAFSVSRQGPATPSASSGIGSGSASPSTPGAVGGSMTGFPAGFRLPPQLPRPNSTPAVPGVKAPTGKGPSLAEKRGLKLPGGLPGAPQQSPSSPPPPQPPTTGAGRQKPKMSLSQLTQPNGDQSNGAQPQQQTEQKKEQSQMDKYAEYIDTKTGALRFKGQATIHGSGVDFSNGRSFSISLDEVDTLDELGKGNYGTVYKVRHSRPKFRKTGQGLAGNKARGPRAEEDSNGTPTSPTRSTTGTTGVVMAMKEIRLELEDAKFAAIIMELDILHRCISPYIIDFFGAFFQEGAVYICMEFMDGGSIDRLYDQGIPEPVLRKITLNTVLGLKSLKEEHNIIHRDVKPTNILISTSGKVKIADFGVSGNLVASIAKTNIGCQSYMAPERISSGGMAAPGGGGGTYSVQSDIWSLGLTIIESAMGRYPYPPETYDNIFSQLSAIVDGAPPDLPADTFSPASRDFVAGCLNKIPKLRPSYPMLLQHAWLAPLAKPATIVEEDEEAAEAAEAGVGGEAFSTTTADGFHDKEVGEWVIAALERRKQGKGGQVVKPALHAAPLDAVGSPEVEKSLNAGVVAVDA